MYFDDKDIDKLNEELNQTIKIDEEFFDEEFSSIEDDKDLKKKNKKPLFSGKKKKYLQIGLASFALVLLIFLTVILFRINDVTQKCKNLLVEDYYSEARLTEKLKLDGFNSFEIKRAIKNCKVDFVDNINKKIYKLVETPDSIKSKSEFKDELSYLGFSDEEIDSLFSSMNWNFFHQAYIGNYINNYEGTLKKNEVLKELESKGYAKEDINFISSLQEWDVLATKYVEEYFNTNKMATKESVKKYLSGYGYSESEIKEIVDEVDWDKQALIYISSYVDSSKNNIEAVEITKTLFESELTKAGFTESEIKYAIENYNFTDAIGGLIKTLVKGQKELISKNEIGKALVEKGFTDSEVNEAFATVDWGYYATSTLAEHLSKNKANKNLSLKYLKDLGYTDDEITYASTKTVWADYAGKALTFLEENNKKTKQELLNTLKDYGYLDSDIQTAKTNTDFKTFAYNYLINTKSQDVLSIIGKKDVESILKTGGYTETVEYEYVIKQFNWNDKALAYLKSLLSSYLTGPTTYSINNIVSKMKEKGFEENSEIKNAFTSYLSKFTEEWVKNYAKNVSEPSRDDLKTKLSSMSTYGSSSNLYNAYYEENNSIKPDWTSLAKKIAKNKKDNGKTEEEVRTLLDDKDYESSEIDAAIEYAFASQE